MQEAGGSKRASSVVAAQSKEIPREEGEDEDEQSDQDGHGDLVEVEEEVVGGEGAPADSSEYQPTSDDE